MAMRHSKGWEQLLSIKALDIIVETGTYRAINTIKLSEVFKEVHSIELSEVLYKEAIEKCEGIANIHLHHGDSSLVIPTLEFEFPIYYFLDAHWCRTKPPVTANDSFPLWKELDFIAQRPHGDVIIVDDIHAFDNRSREASDPRYNDDWNGVNIKTILEAVRKHKPVIGSFEFHDCFVMYV